jgi:hypothetical protein
MTLVERKANPDIERMLNVFDLHFSTPAMRKQCLEFALPKPVEICKYLADACNSNSHARGLHYLTFCLLNKAGKINAMGRVILRKCFRKAQRYLSS